MFPLIATMITPVDIDFVEGLVRYWDGLEIPEQTSTKKFKRPKSLFNSKKTVYDGFSNLFDQFRDSIIVVSYSSNGIQQAGIEIVAFALQEKSCGL